MFTKFRDPVSSLTHIFGALFSVIGLIILLSSPSSQGNTLNMTCLSIFGISLILLYTASSVYHTVISSQKVINVLRRIDHSMIYVLIAGSYTPLCLIGLKGKLGITILITIWSLTIFGIIFKNLWFNAPRWLSTALYIIMGWLVIIAIYPLSKVISFTEMMWLFSGGIMYTVGGLIYATKWPKITTKYFGFHEIFHVFILLGSFCHFMLMLNLIK